MIEKAILEFIYDAASIQRWNDHVRPGSGFTELDKQAHKMIIAYMLGKFEETDRRAMINWRGLIEGGIFEFLHRIVLTDIKPVVFHKLMEQKGRQLNRWVLDKLAGMIGGMGEISASILNSIFSIQSTTPWRRGSCGHRTISLPTGSLGSSTG